MKNNTLEDWSKDHPGFKEVKRSTTLIKSGLWVCVVFAALLVEIGIFLLNFTSLFQSGVMK